MSIVYGGAEPKDPAHPDRDIGAVKDVLLHIRVRLLKSELGLTEVGSAVCGPQAAVHLTQKGTVFTGITGQPTRWKEGIAALGTFTTDPHVLPYYNDCCGMTVSGARHQTA